MDKRWPNALVAAGMLIFLGALFFQESEFNPDEELQARIEAATLPPPVAPPDNPYTREAAELGRHLFYDERLSSNRTVSCASCHLQELAFSDGKAHSTGATGELTPRNSMSLTNVAYNAVFNWADPDITTLEQHARLPLLGDHPIEMGIGGQEGEVLARLVADERYRGLFAAAYGEDAITFDNVVRALATFQRGLISLDSAYDRFLAGDSDALSPAAQRGLDLFFSTRTNCFRCHGGANFRFTIGHRVDDEDTSVAFHNIGLYNVDGAGAYPEGNQGLFEKTGDPRDRGRFKAPTLRNITVTAPYMHDGSVATLREVMAIYAQGGRRVETGENAGDGRLSPLKSELMTGFVLSEEDTEAVLAFLHSLTDENFLVDEALSDPFR